MPSASVALTRRDGSISRQRIMTATNEGSSRDCGCVRASIIDFGFHAGKLVSRCYVFLKCGRQTSVGQASFVGVPSVWNILNSWSISESPWQNGFFMIISSA